MLSGMPVILPTITSKMLRSTWPFCLHYRDALRIDYRQRFVIGLKPYMSLLPTVAFNPAPDRRVECFCNELFLE
jgi:hypothetical protein